MKGHITFDHIGMLVKDVDKTVECLKLLPNAGEFVFHPTEKFQEPGLMVGKPFAAKGAEGEICGIKFEVLQPIPEESVGSYVMERMEKYGEGLHHIDLSFDSREDFDEYLDILIKNGGILQHRDAGECFGLYWGEGVYVDMPAGGLCIALAYREPLKK